jgi:two-component system chemotaxis response regulator CheB
MPRMDGLTFLDKLMKHHPLPVIVLSSLAHGSQAVALDALRRGAVDVIPKPGGPYSVGDLRGDLPNRIRAAARAKLAPQHAPAVIRSEPAPISVNNATRLIVIGASTGGTVAVEELLRVLPAAMPPIAIVQHIPAGFSKTFADRLNTVTSLHVEEAYDNALLVPGKVLIAPGNWHMELQLDGGKVRAKLSAGPKVCYQRPAVDVLFRSVISFGESCTAVLLTGMGNDGAHAMQLLHQKGAYTMAQSEASCVVYGMPKEAVALGAVDWMGTAAEIGAQLVHRCIATRMLHSQRDGAIVRGN